MAVELASNSNGQPDQARSNAASSVAPGPGATSPSVTGPFDAILGMTPPGTINSRADGRAAPGRRRTLVGMIGTGMSWANDPGESFAEPERTSPRRFGRISAR